MRPLLALLCLLAGAVLEVRYAHAGLQDLMLDRTAAQIGAI